MKRLLLVLAVAACSKATPPEPTASSGAAPVAAPVAGLSLAVTVDGKPETWGQDVFDRVPHFIVKNTGGDNRDAWSLHELAKIAGPDARVTAVVGDPRQAIDAAAWADPAKIPIVHRTRRGGLKFRWTDSAGTWSAAEIKDVTGLELTRAAP
jgi:hypothetical protein